MSGCGKCGSKSCPGCQAPVEIEHPQVDHNGHRKASKADPDNDGD